MKSDVLHDVGADEFNYQFSSFFSLEVHKNNWFLPSLFLASGKFGQGIGGEVMVFRSFNRR